jgi:hypothetical protein
MKRRAPRRPLGWSRKQTRLLALAKQIVALETEHARLLAELDRCLQTSEGQLRLRQQSRRWLRSRWTPATIQTSAHP